MNKALHSPVDEGVGGGTEKGGGGWILSWESSVIRRN